MKLFRILSILLVFPLFISAQIKEQTGWLASFNSLKFNDKWGMHLDVQIRSSDDIGYVRNVLVRPGVTYYINKKSNATVGYLLNQTYTRQPDNQLTEHRIWQQYLYNQAITPGITLAHRFRLEQRFIERAADKVFAQRLRYFARAVIPIQNGGSVFKKGVFAALQNEVFLNVQNTDKLNGSTYDQNRAYAAFGYRLNPKVDIEAGYLNQSINGRAVNTTNHVFQLALYTRL